MALQFFAVHSDALAFTHDSLRRHAQQTGTRPPGPTRALRIAQLYGHLQVRGAGRRAFSLPLGELAASWRLQPRQLRQDLALLQELGWLEARGTSRGTQITLHNPEPAASPSSHPPPAAASDTPTSTPPPARPHRPHQDRSAAEPALLEALVALYNQHRPPSWSAYQPRGTALLGRIRQALRHAGDSQRLQQAFLDALQAMPPFWRDTYPQGRSGAECFSALFQSDRSCAALGVDYWHLFRWSAQRAEAGAGQGSTGEVSPAGDSGPPPEEPLARARRLLVWDAGLWRGLGREALRLSAADKRELARLLEDHGIGIPGSADRQFPCTEAVASAAEPPEPSDGLTTLEPSAGPIAVPLRAVGTSPSLYGASPAVAATEPPGDGASADAARSSASRPGRLNPIPTGSPCTAPTAPTAPRTPSAPTTTTAPRPDRPPTACPPPQRHTAASASMP
jgi:hypothetical protein